MKPIKFDLPLNSIRVATLDQLEENLTPEILQHFRSGKLAKWLRVRHLNEQADKVEALLAADIEDEVQLFKNVCEVFVGEIDENDQEIFRPRDRYGGPGQLRSTQSRRQPRGQSRGQ